MAGITFKIERISNFKFKWNYLKNEKHFLNFLFHFWNLHQILNILRKTMLVIANVFPKLQVVKTFLRPFCKKRHFGTHFNSQHVKVSPILRKCSWERFSLVFPSFWGNLTLKMSLLVLSKILGVFLNTFTADCKYPVKDWENVTLRIQMQLSEKQKIFS